MGHELKIRVWKKNLKHQSFSTIHHFFYGSNQNFQILVYKNFWQNTYIPSWSKGDICKCKQSFCTLHNWFFHKLYYIVVVEEGRDRIYCVGLHTWASANPSQLKSEPNNRAVMHIELVEEFLFKKDSLT